MYSIEEPIPQKTRGLWLWPCPKVARHHQIASAGIKTSPALKCCPKKTNGLKLHGWSGNRFPCRSVPQQIQTNTNKSEQTNPIFQIPIDSICGDVEFSFGGHPCDLKTSISSQVAPEDQIPLRGDNGEAWFASRGVIYPCFTPSLFYL